MSQTRGDTISPALHSWDNRRFWQTAIALFCEREIPHRGDLPPFRTLDYIVAINPGQNHLVT